MTPSEPLARIATATTMAARLKLLAHPERLLMLCRMDEGEISVNGLVVLSGLSQSAVSQHLALMRHEGAVISRGEAQTRYYSLGDPVLRRIIHALGDICGEGPIDGHATGGETGA